MTEIKFKQIAATPEGETEGACVYGLDESGCVWEGYRAPIADTWEFIWRPLPMPEDDRPERSMFP
jgi:hypothetical protein